MMRLGIDVGGTFTDFVAYDSTTGTLRAWKNLSTPDDPTEGILTGASRRKVILAAIGCSVRNGASSGKSCAKPAKSTRFCR